MLPTPVQWWSRSQIFLHVISDNYLSATVVSFQKKTVVHICSILLARHTFGFIYDRAEGRVCLPFSLLVFSSLFSQYPQQRRLMYLTHPEPPWAGSRVTLTPGIFVFPGDVSFVLLCTHRAPGSSCPACFTFGRTFNFILGTSDWASDASNQCIRALVPIIVGTATSFSVTKKPSTASSCRKVSWIPLELPLSTWRTASCQLSPLFFEPTRRSSFRMLSSVVLAVGLVHFTIRWSAPPFRRRNDGV